MPLPLSDSEPSDDDASSKPTKSHPSSQQCHTVKCTCKCDVTKEGLGTTSEPAMMTKKFFYRFLPKEAIYENDGQTSKLTLTFTSERGKFMGTKSLVCAGVVGWFI